MLFSFHYVLKIIHNLKRRNLINFLISNRYFKYCKFEKDITHLIILPENLSAIFLL